MDTTGRLVAGWILEERLGHGGFGEVWKARRPHADLLRALKLVPVSSERAFLGWRQEINRLDELSHPNIVRFYDADIVADPGPYEDFAWIATELCERSLADELQARPGHVLAEDQVAPLATAMLAALAAAHGSGCVHRDVKPANILLHRSGVWKLCDFGTARLVPPGESHPRTDVVGTFPYMSPAAHRGRQDAAADLYALGVTVHEALCGIRLHPRPNGMTDSEYVVFIMDTPPVISPQLYSRWRGLVAALSGLDGPHTARELLIRFADTTAITFRQPLTETSPTEHGPDTPMSGSTPPAPPTSGSTPSSPSVSGQSPSPPSVSGSRQSRPSASGSAASSTPASGSTPVPPPASGRAGESPPMSGPMYETTAQPPPTRRQPPRSRTERQQPLSSGGGRQQPPSAETGRQQPRSSASSRERAHVLGLLGVIAGSVVVAGVLLFQALPAAVAAGIVVGVLLVVVLLIALS